MKQQLILLGASGLLLAGCATSSDPAAGGFGNAVRGLSSGGYQQRIDDRENTVAAQQSNMNSLTARADALRAERQKLELEISRADQRVSDLKRRTRQIEAELSQHQNDQSVALAELAKVKARLNKVEQARAQIDAQDKTKPVGDLKDNISDVIQDLDELDAVLDALTGG